MKTYESEDALAQHTDWKLEGTETETEPRPLLAFDSKFKKLNEN